jgi:hypothetical protein
MKMIREESGGGRGEVFVTPTRNESSIKGGEDGRRWVGEKEWRGAKEATVETTEVVGPSIRCLAATCKKETLDMAFQRGKEVVNEVYRGEAGGGSAARVSRCVAMDPHFVNKEAEDQPPR